MSGTSFDGIDVAIIETDGKNFIQLLGGQTFEYPISFANRLKNIVAQKDYLMMLEIEKELTRYHGVTINEFIKSQNIHPSVIDYIGFHGQTILHEPAKKLTLQLGNPHLLAEMTGINVVSDFRRGDMSAGGCGAPLVPIFHQALAKLLKLDQVVFLNIGGVSNITYLNGDEMLAFDTGPGNALINDFIYTRTGALFDKDGLVASAGQVDFSIVDNLLSDVFFQTKPPKALDRDHFNTLLQSVSHLNMNDGAATISYFTAASFNQALQFLGPVKNIIVCGGGRKNLFVMDKIAKISGISTIDIDDFKINGDLIEAYAFGYLAARSSLRLPISYPSTTGIDYPKSGGSITSY